MPRRGSRPLAVACVLCYILYNKLVNVTKSRRGRIWRIGCTLPTSVVTRAPRNRLGRFFTSSPCCRPDVSLKFLRAPVMATLPVLHGNPVLGCERDSPGWYLGALTRAVVGVCSVHLVPFSESGSTAASPKAVRVPSSSGRKMKFHDIGSCFARHLITRNCPRT